MAGRKKKIKFEKNKQGEHPRTGDKNVGPNVYIRQNKKIPRKLEGTNPGGRTVLLCREVMTVSEGH